MRPAGVAQSEGRLLASGALVQQAAQGAGLVALLVIVTVLARRLSVTELGAYGLVASLAGYLLVLRNSVASSAVRAMASAVERDERRQVFCAAAALYTGAGVATGVLIALAGLLIAGLILEGSLAGDARVGALGLGALTAAGVTASVWLDALRAERQFVRAAGIEIVAVALYLATMLGLIFGGAGLGAVIAVSGALPLYSGTLSALSARRLRLGLRWRPSTATRPRVMEIVPTAGWLLVIELCNLAMYAFSRVILGAFKSPREVGLFEGPVRAHNLLYALGGALAVPVVPTGSRYVATGDERRLRDLAVRGTRYTLALFVPLCVTLMVLSGPILGAWLGDRYVDGDAALSILVSYWLVYGGLIVTPGFLVGAGLARYVARVMVVVATVNLILSLSLTPVLGLEGPAIATAVPFFLAFPVLLRLGLRASGATVAELARRAWAPNYTLGALLAVALLAGRVALPMDSTPTVLALAAGGVLAYWAVFAFAVLDAGERSLLSRSGPAR
ncbi:MAG TPA: oligosaccharide flippase family protein [Thermoleophilaceae bacterium]|nr:oligosaccharide flippase family protein [Thermoleophilaceae bacterium]